MKKITLMILLSLMSFCGFAQGLPEEGFEDPWTGTPAAPPGWQVINQFGPTVTWVQNPFTAPDGPTPPYQGEHAAYLNKETVSPSAAIPVDWLITPTFTMPANGELYFMSKLTLPSDSGGLYKIFIMNVAAGNETTPVTPADFAGATQNLATWTETQMDPAQQQQYVQKKLVIPATWTGSVRIAFVMEGNNKDRWLIDNVRVSEACLAPSTLTAGNQSLTTADLSWTNPGGVSWDVQVVEEADVPNDTDWVTYTGTLPYVKTNLEPCTSYKYYVRQRCGEGSNVSDPVGPFFFKTRCPGETCATPIVIPPALPYSTFDNTANYTDFYENSPGTGCNGPGNYLAGNDVVYSFTPAVTGNVVITLTQTNGPAGLFIYEDCTDIGVACMGGGTATADDPVELDPFPVIEDTTYYLVVSTNGSPQTTPYMLSIQQGSCPKPTEGTATTTGTTASLSWTEGSPGATSWEIVVQPSGTGIPTGAGDAVTDNEDYEVSETTAGLPLMPATTYEYYVREGCPGGTFSIWAGPFLFTTTQVAADLNYTQNFDNGNHGWTLGNGTQTNKWYVGTATSNSPSSSLYISNNNGVSNSYTNSSTTTVHAYRDLQMPDAIGQLSLSYDWKCYGEGTQWDYITAWIVPASFTPEPGEMLEDEDDPDIIQIGTFKNLSDVWNTSVDIITAPASWNGTVRRLVFQWRNDSSGGSQPPAAIDNVNVSIITCPQPTELAVNDLDQTEAQIGWEAPAIVPPTYDIYYSTTNTPPTGTTEPNLTSNTTSAIITPLTTSATYFVWVRSHCSDSDKSFWTGPVSFNTPQIPAEMNYTQNFDLGAHNFTLSNGTQTNQWVVGTATSNSSPNSLYISEDGGTTNTYNTGDDTAVHAYRDILMPDDIPSDELLLKFDWKCGGEGTVPYIYDYITVWMVPVTYSPTPGLSIADDDNADEAIQVGTIHNLSNNLWVNQLEVIAAPDAWDGTVKRLIFEWNSDTSAGTMPGGAIDNISLSVLTCPAPIDFALDEMSLGTATFTWTAPASDPEGYDYYYSESNTPPTDATEPTGSVTDTTVTLEDLPESTNYHIWIRSDCGDADGNSFWIGPVDFLTPQTPADMDYSQNFDSGAHGWALNNGTQENIWVVGSATSNSPANSLYISNDNGTTNAYSIEDGSVVQAYRDILMPDNIDQLVLTFDWKSIGDQYGDYFRVWMVPVTYGPTPGEEITDGTDRIQLGGDFLGTNTWKSEQIIIYDAAPYGGEVRRLVFEWINNDYSGTQPPAAIDNIALKVVTCPQPTDLEMTANTEAGTTFTWTAPSVAPAEYDYFLTSSPVAPTATATPTGSTTTNTVTLTPPLSSNFYFYVRSHCSDTDQSFWTGPINFNTVQVPVDLNYSQNFDSAVQDWALSNGNQTNKWYVGPATFNSASNSLYISNDNSVTNSYNTGSTTTVHAYRDFNIPASAAQLDLSFDWKAFGEGTPPYIYDYIRVWMVPTSFTPNPGSQINNGGGRVRVVESLNQNADWTNVVYTVPTTGFAGGTMRLVFEWRNDGGGGSNPPGAIDNINLKVVTCPQPSALGASEIGMTQAKLNWTETGTANEWDVYVVESGSPAPTEETEGTDAPTNPFNYTLLESATSYEYYVRSVCGPGDLSRWSGPYPFYSSICEVVNQCSYDFILTDSGDDGWNGNTITVSQGGIPIAVLGPQIEDGGPVTVSVPLCSGIPYEVFYDKPENIYNGPEEVGLSIVNPSNSQTVFNRVAGTVASDIGTILYTGIAYCQEITCPQPSNLLSETAVNIPNTTELSWSPNGTETKWEVVIQAQGGDFPSETPAESVIVEEDPEYQYGGLVEGQLYEYYVRAICDEENNDKSFWTGPLYFSLFTPPACADVTVLDPDLEIIAPDTEYVLCPGEDVCVDFSANFYAAAAATTSYAVEEIDYALPFPATGGTEMDITQDDIWSPKINLPFEFCFFGQVYNAAQVGSNGIVTFNADKVSGSGSGYSYEPETVPSPTFPQLNAIYGVYQDTNPFQDNNTWDDPNINYQVLGNYPCRALVVSFNGLAQFGCSSDSEEDQEVGMQASQIVMYEITNIVEVYVTRRVPCLSWEAGAGVIGLQNADGTVGFTPEGRNTGAWSTEEEAWRFTPNGEITATLEWFKNGELFSNEENIQVCADPGTTVMTARASYVQCNGETVVRESDFTIRVEEVILPTNEPVDLAKCGNGEDITFDLNVAMADVFTDPADYVYTFYTSEAAATEGGTDNITAPEAFVTTETTTIWVRIMRDGYPCFITRSFDVVVSNVPPDFTVTPDFSMCEGTSGTIIVTPGDFDEADATYAWTLDGNPLPDTTSSITVTEGGAYEVTVTTNIGCVASATTNVTSVPVPVADEPADVTVCGSYELPALTSGNYFDGPAGTGNAYSAGDSITTTVTMYVYAESGTTPNCTDESSFIITVNESPVATAPDDVTVCDSYELPALAEAGNNYYTSPGGTGTMLNAGDIITTSQTIYVYEETGTTPNCFAEDSFVVTIAPTPVADELEDVSECDSYTLPALSAGNNYYTATGGTGTMLNAGQTITSTQVVYVFAETGTTPNCTDESSFTVTITPTPEFTIEDGCDGNEYIVSVANLNADDATYEWTGPDGFTSTEREFVAPAEGTYTVVVTTGQGCTTEANVEVLDISCSIPRGISPNHDGLNDEFDLTSLKVRKLEIFNRYGQEVYSKNGYTNQWHGQGNNGNELPTGTYYYMIEREGGQTKTGWVYINREE